MNNIIFGDRFVSVSDSLYITAISMSIVFSVLVLICFFVACMKYIPQAKAVKNTAVKEVQKPTRIPEQAGNEQEINYEDENIRLALMVASMEAVAEEENAWIKIRSVREII
ncbi:MAG TPA: OadG family protein [Fusobacterium sp.]|uniref:OadG family protein n=1 Tax=Fusobacterium sp. TaxID=68766 RepID=UPI002F4141B8